MNQSCSQMPDHDRVPRKRRKKAHPDELLAAALDLFVEKGFSATNLNDVAKRAGVSKATVYLYFDNKEALFRAVIEEFMVPFLADRDQLIAIHEGNLDSLARQLLAGWWSEIGETPLEGLTKLIIAEARNFPEIASFFYEKVILRHRSQLRSLLERAVRQGELRPVDIETAAEVLHYTVLMKMIWHHSFCDIDLDSNMPVFLQTMFEIHEHGLKLQNQ